MKLVILGLLLYFIGVYAVVTTALCFCGQCESVVDVMIRIHGG